MEETVLSIQNLTQKYSDFVAVDDVSFEVKQGEIFGFLGPNGAGKTSTIRTVLDFLRPAHGSVRVFGLDSVEKSLEIRKRVGYLPSELKLWENWRGTQYIKWLESVHNKPLMNEANRLADALDFDLNRSLKGMSTGMKRKMGIIAALAHKPELLILDEPTSGLDPLMQKTFDEFMLEAKTEGRTIFLSSHMLTEVEQICDRVGIIREGKLEAIETVKSLMHSTFRWVTFALNSPARINGFVSIDGVSDVTVNDNEIKMRVTGAADMGEVLRQAAQNDVRDFDVQKPSLEEVFLAFYGEKEEK